MPSCREVAALLATGDADTAPWWKRAALRMHLAMCAHCSRFARQIAAMGAAFRTAWPPARGQGDAPLRRRIVERLLKS